MVLELLTSSPQGFTIGMIWAGFRVWKLTGFFILQYNVKMGRLLPSIRVGNRVLSPRTFDPVLNAASTAFIPFAFKYSRC
jgi:hypothetical protein